MIAFEEGAAVPVADYRRLRSAVGWGELPHEDDELAAAFGRTWNVVARRDGEIVGLARLLDDGVLYASVWDMLARPTFSGRASATPSSRVSFAMRRVGASWC